MTIESIDNRSDFKTYMQNYVYARGSVAPKGPRREGPPEDGFVSPIQSFIFVFSSFTLSATAVTDA
jgi:hypothetical protein